LSNNTIKLRIQELSIDILKQTIAAAKQSENLNSELGENTDLGNDAQFIVFVRLRTTWNDLFWRPLATNTTGKEMFEKVYSFIQDSFRGLTVCLFAQMALRP